MILKAGERNQNLHVLGMSGTPIINNLMEGRSLVEMITGYKHEDLRIKDGLPELYLAGRRL